MGNHGRGVGSAALRAVVLWGALASCSSPFEPVDVGPCARSGGGAWTLLGLERGHSFLSLAETDWGIFAGMSTGGVYRCSPETGRWEGLGLEHVRPESMAFVREPTPRLYVAVSGHGPQDRPGVSLYMTENAGRRWTALGNPGGTRAWARSVAVDPTDPDRVFVGLSTGGSILRSKDGARSWDFVAGNPQSWGGRGMREIFMPPRADGWAWAGGNNAFGWALMFRSSDRGETWEPILPYRGDGHVFHLALDQGDPPRLYAGALWGVMISDDYGETWRFTLGEDTPAPIRLIGAVLVRGDRVYAVGGTNRPFPDMHTDLAVFVSEDRGDTWQPVPVPEGLHGADRALLTSEGRILVGTAEATGLWEFDPDA